MALERKWAHMVKEKKCLTPVDFSPRSPEHITIALPGELRGQMGAGRGKIMCLLQ